MGTSDPLLKPEHTIRELLTYFMIGIRIVGIGMVAVIKLYDMETAAINVEVNIALFKIWSDGFPDLHFWMQLLDCAPSCIADSFAMCLGGYKQQVEIATFTINLYDYTSNRLAVLYDPVCLTAVDSLLNSLMGNDLTVFFEVVVPEPELLQRSVVKCFLIFPDELLPVIRSQRIKCYFCHSHLL